MIEVLMFSVNIYSKRYLGKHFLSSLKLENESMQAFSVRLKKKITYHCAFSVKILKEKFLEQFLRALKNKSIQSKLSTWVDDLTFQRADVKTATLENV